jgi:hypothetical protein
MERILAERTVTVEVDGQPVDTMRVMVGFPVMVDEGEWQTEIEIHGPRDWAVLKNAISGVDAWQSVRGAFWLCLDLVRSRASSKARLTHEGQEDWSCEMARRD